MGWESSDVVRFDLEPPSRSNYGSLASVSCLSGGYSLYHFSNARGLVYARLVTHPITLEPIISK